MSVNVVLNVRLCLSHANRDVGQITHDTPPPPPIRDCFFWPFSGRECFPRAFRFAFLATSTPRDTAVARLEPIVNREHTVHMFKFCFYQVLFLPGVGLGDNHESQIGFFISSRFAGHS